MSGAVRNPGRRLLRAATMGGTAPAFRLSAGACQHSHTERMNQMTKMAIRKVGTIRLTSPACYYYCNTQ